MRFPASVRCAAGNFLPTSAVSGRSGGPVRMNCWNGARHQSRARRAHCRATGEMSLRIGVPNWLTILRVALIPVLVVLYILPFHWGHPAAALAFLFAALTDWLDGYLARRLDQGSRLGAFLDPVADKLLVVHRPGAVGHGGRPSMGGAAGVYHHRARNCGFGTARVDGGAGRSAARWRSRGRESSRPRCRWRRSRSCFTATLRAECRFT